MADSASLAVINEEIAQKNAQKARLNEEKTTLQARIAAIDLEIANIDAAINDLQVTAGTINPVPTIAGLDLTEVILESTGNSLTVDGTGFVNGETEILLNGSAQATTFISGTQVSCSIPDAMAQVIGAITVQVRNPSPGGGTSATVNLQVVYGSPTLLTVVPNSLPEGSPDTLITCTGSNFYDDSVVYFNNAPFSTALVSGDLQATVPASALATAGIPVTVRVENPTPGGGASASLVITVT